MFSDGYEFLKAVKDRNGDEVTDALNQPGTTVINARDITSGETALHIVTARRDVIWIQFLSQKGANPNIADKKGVTPLMLAVSLGFVEGVEALIDAGARTDVANDAGETPLIAAVHRRDVAMVRLLLSKGADAERNDNSGRSARDYATLMGRSSSMLEEIERADEERKNMPQAKSYGPSF
ncbi:MAG: ankyrin repeat domain-containing protein [Sphingomonadaceae bacterium]|nr:ankyrin repeat domain-containing protein [Sphingomonadaceae bacterium]